MRLVSPYCLARGSRHRRRRAFLALALALGAAACQSQSVRKAQELVEKGDKLLAEQRVAEAQAAYRSALVHAPDYLPARVGVGRIDAMAGKLEAAIRQFEAVLAKDPDCGEAYAGWGETLWRAGRFPEAEEKYQRAGELLPDSPSIATDHAMALVALGRDDEGLALFERASQRGAEFPGNAFLFWGAALERKGKKDEALAKYEAAAARDPDDPTIQNNLGLMLVRLGKDPQRGIELLEQAIARNPADPNTLYNLGWSYLQAERYPEAVDYLQRSVGSVNPNSPALAKQLESLRLAQSKLVRKQAPVQAPNVVLVVIDSLRADHLGAYGYARPTSPNLDRLAAGGVLFEQAISQAPWTAASVASLLTGLEPSVHGLDGDELRGPERDSPAAGNRVQKPLRASNRTLAEVLRDSGYRTAGFVSAPHLHSLFGFAQGFDAYRDVLATDPHQGSPSLRPGETNRLVSEWLTGAIEEPFFLFVHYDQPTSPYNPPSPHGDDFIKGYRGRLTPHTSSQVIERLGKPITSLGDEDLRYLVGLYDGEIQYADAQLGELLARVRSAKLARPLLAVVTAGHGEELLDHGSGGHGWTLYDEQVRVPLVVHFPGRLAPRRVPAQVRLIDVLPTLLELTGVPAEGSPLQGESLAALARGVSTRGPEQALSEVPLSGAWKSLRTSDGAKLIRNMQNGTALLFELRSDPGERNDLAAEPASAGRRDALAAALAQHVEKSRALRADVSGGEALEGRIALETETRESQEPVRGE